MEFTVIPNEQTPEIAMVQDEFILDYIKQHRSTLDAFIEYASTHNDAVGLAANQCALDDERYMVRAFAYGGRERNWRLIIDPVIIRQFGIKEMKAEGCLTWKNMVIAAERYRQVEVQYYDINGKLYQEIYKGFNAQIWQHEVNHLNGIEEDVKIYFKEPEPITVGRNEPCPCGSGLKYKKCCLAI